MSATASVVRTADPSLKAALLFDAALSGASAVALLAAAGPLAQLTGLPSSLLFVVGIVFAGCAALMAFTATRAPIPLPLAWLIALGNLAWVVASLVFAALWPVANVYAAVLVVGQALAVVVLAWLELRALRQG